LKVEIKSENCMCYAGHVVSDIKLAPSPVWMQQRLKLVGLKPINNIVDITNYVLWEIGQPLHAFDYNKINGASIIVQMGQGETFKALNTQEYKLCENTLVVADKSKPLAMAGVMGGFDESVGDKTTAVVFESAIFDRANIRKTSRRLGLRTDASARFERGVAPVLCQMGISRALNLVNELKIGNITKTTAKAGFAEAKNKILSFEYSLIPARFGLDVQELDAIAILGRLGIKTTITGGVMQCVIPSIRTDLINADDICEEIIRIYGFDKLPSTLMEKAKITISVKDRIQLLGRELKQLMISAGAHEVITLPLNSPAIAEKLLMNEPKDVVKISNPLGLEYSVMRTEMAHSLLEVINTNLKRKNREFAIFEWGRIYQSTGETDVLAYATCKQDAGFLSTKAVLELVSSKLGIPFGYKKTACPYLHPNLSADMFVGNNKVGYMGKVHPVVLKNLEMDVNTNIYLFELSLNKLPDTKKRKPKPLPKFPASERDLAVVVDETVAAGELLDLVKSKAGSNCESVEFLDEYKGIQIGSGKKSIALRLVFRNASATLTDTEVQGCMDLILTALETKYNAKIR
ncbi:MAG: phenylalanine--tRNA ligase subunit beta, partial [Firmicutes bacterium]|nr:phenylalanine--tRNA ligase subunit beta [Bacillota bacterium]